jgi:hypothetical protein
MPVEILLDEVVKITLTPTNTLQKTSISSATYKEISFNNYTKLFGLKENKRLKSLGAR